MANKALFEDLVFDEFDNPVKTTQIGDESFYIVDDQGFERHISSEYVDRQILGFFKDQIKENKDLITEQTAKYLGQEDIFSKAMIDNQFENIDEQFEKIMKIGFPKNNLDYMGLMGFRVNIDFHGDVININQPTTTEEE
jgi:hypothetical protein